MIRFRLPKRKLRLFLAGWVLCISGLTIVYDDRLNNSAPAGALAEAEKKAARKIAATEFNAPGCSALVRQYCEKLYSPQYMGNITIDAEDYQFEIKQGKTENEFSYAYYHFAKAKLDFRVELPKDFVAVLDDRNMFEELKDYLRRKPRMKMTLEERAENLRLANRLDEIWDSSVEVTVLNRMERKYPRYSKLPPGTVPFEMQQSYVRVKRKLLSEIAVGLWHKHPNWQKVKRQFKTAREAFLRMIEEEPRLAQPIKDDWRDRLASVRLIIPGSEPSVDMGDCVSTRVNAYYYPEHNFLTVCAGDFNTEDSYQTLLHELAHALDFSRTLRIFEENSRLAERLRALSRMSCQAEPFSCSDWRDLKSAYSSYLDDFDRFTPQVSDFLKCLQTKPVEQTPEAEYVERIAREETVDLTEWAARNDLFLKLVKEALPLPSGRMQKNPLYLNACANNPWYTENDVLDDETTLLLFYSAEYRCSLLTEPDERMRAAIEVAKTMQQQLIEKRIAVEGAFSSRGRLQADGYADAPHERFADALAARVFAKILDNYSKVEVRRSVYMANVAWQCSQPTLRQHFPTEAKVQKEFYFDPYSEGIWRQQELLLEPVRQSLQCEKDFELNECEL